MSAAIDNARKLFIGSEQATVECYVYIQVLRSIGLRGGQQYQGIETYCVAGQTVTMLAPGLLHPFFAIGL